MRFRCVAGAVLLAGALGVGCKKPEGAPEEIIFPRPRPLKQGLPTFTIRGQSLPALTLLVDKGTSRESLRALVLAFRTAREQGRLAELIPSTTPKAPIGPYGIVNVYVMSDPKWADEQHLIRAIDSALDEKFTKQFDAHTLATYFLSQVGGLSELGLLGPNNGTGSEKLFSAGM